MSCERCSALGRGLRLFACAVVLVVGSVLVTSRVMSDDKTPPDKKMTEGEKKAAEAMAEWMKYATPGEHHGYLKPLAGDWNAEGKFRMDPAADWQEFPTAGSAKWILGERFLLSNWTGEMFGAPFEGVGILGYDIYNKKYDNVWMDNMGTMMMVTEGTASSNGKIITFNGSYEDPATKSKKRSKTIYRIESNDKIIFEMYGEGPDGKDFKSMEIVQTRKS